jgi:hypothetical protein
MVIKQELIDELLSDYKNPEDLLGDGGIFKELKKELNENEPETSFSEHPSLFDDVCALGRNVALVGMAYHPLCLMFHRAVNSCYGMGYWPNRNREHVLTRLDDVLRSISLKVPGVVRLKARLDGAHKPHPHIAGFLKTLDELDKRIIDPAHGLIYGHLVMPHRPYFYDRHFNDFVPPRDDDKHYSDALELIDRTVGRIVKSLKKSGSSDDTLLVLTADHGFKNDAIPLVIKWPGKKYKDIPRSLVRPFGLRAFVRAYLAG